jgi:hypothetical protein
MRHKHYWRKAGERALLILGLLALGAAAAAAQGGYVPCLGCAEHQEIETRWHRPFWAQLSSESVLLFNHFRIERQARDLGMCETDVLIRSPQAINGCHPFSAKRAWLIEAPLEVLAFTSPAWGLERRGHPRWAMLLEAVPMTYHLVTIHETANSIHQWNRLTYLLR